MMMIPLSDAFRVAPPSSVQSLPTVRRRKRTMRGNCETSDYLRFMIAPQQLGTFEPLTTTRTITAESKSENINEQDIPVREQRRVVWENWIRDINQNEKTNNSKNNHIESQPQVQQYTTVPFQAAWDYQKQLLQQHLDRIKKQQQKQHGNNHDIPSSFLTSNSTIGSEGLDTVIMVQHDPVYTLGTASDEGFIHSNKNVNGDDEVPIVRIDRGGEVTYHGPGQLVVYPILDLRNYKMDIHWYVRALEEVVIRALHRSGMSPSHQVSRQDNLTGVFVNDQYKVAAVGIKCRSWITQHGFAINITPQSIPQFQNIVPCGIPDRAVGCVHQFWNDPANIINNNTATNPIPPISMTQMAEHVRAAFEEVFLVELIENSKFRI